MRFSSKFWAQCATIIAGFTAMEAKASSTLDVVTSQTLTVGTKISGGGTLIKTGLGTLLLNYDNSLISDGAGQTGSSPYTYTAGHGSSLAAGLQPAFTGATQVQAGTLEIDHGNALGGTSGGVLTMWNQATLAANVSGAGSITIPNAIVLGDGTTTLPTVFVNCNNDSLTLSGNISNANGSGTLFLDVMGGQIANSVITLSDLNNGLSNWGTTVSNVTLRIADHSAIGSGLLTLGASNPSGAEPILSMLQSVADTINLGNAITLSGAATIDTGYNSQTKVFSANGLITGSGLLTKINTGHLILGGTNTNTGGITVSGGTLRLTNSAAAGSGTISLAGGTTLAGHTSSGSFANPITMTGNAILLPMQSFTASGVIAGAFGLTISGANTVTLAGVNTYTGTTTLAGAATLSISAANQLSAAALIMGQGTALHVTGAMTLPCGISL